MKSVLSVLVLCLGLAACGRPVDLDQPADPLGNFRLGFNVITVLDENVQGPLSRDVTETEWEEALQKSFDRRFSQFNGDRLYHLGITVVGYVVAVPGIPVVLSPKSILMFDLNVIDNETRQPLNAPGERLTVIESFTGSNIVGSGLTSSKDEQIEDLAARAAQQAENWMRTQPWFFGTGAGLPEPATAAQ